ncbi:uncharacterized protein EV420DRAFT_1063105 [Desarmillaria tabescens]|uniref:Uncharacterized protein n=1 Tax=Armillaria tabescens TaxID=1929756 RepID=A0AA39TS80_ARMTA|nr:uncharacterized protein EV420DRAFT_1063105 [Desarmillaria tabescens]KAK0464773.1 hypothetical protein EV420DRAFT_1063105 [Desarmillaria tabescens]
MQCVKQNSVMSTTHSHRYHPEVYLTRKGSVTSVHPAMAQSPGTHTFGLQTRKYVANFRLCKGFLSGSVQAYAQEYPDKTPIRELQCKKQNRGGRANRGNAEYSLVLVLQPSQGIFPTLGDVRQAFKCTRSIIERLHVQTIRERNADSRLRSPFRLRPRKDKEISQRTRFGKDMSKAQSHKACCGETILESCLRRQVEIHIRDGLALLQESASTSD